MQQVEMKLINGMDFPGQKNKFHETVLAHLAQKDSCNVRMWLVKSFFVKILVNRIKFFIQKKLHQK